MRLLLTGDDLYRHGDPLRYSAGRRRAPLPAHDREITSPQRLSAECHRHQAWNVEADRTLFYTEYWLGRPVKSTHVFRYY